MAPGSGGGGAESGGNSGRPLKPSSSFSSSASNPALLWRPLPLQLRHRGHIWGAHVRSGARLRPPRRRPRSSLPEGWTLAGPGSRTAPGPHRRRRTAPGIAPPATSAGPSCRITSTWRVTPRQKPAFLCPKKPRRSTRLSTNPSPDSDSLQRLDILHCRETAPDPFSLTYQTFQIFPKLISMGRIQTFRSP